MKAQRLSPVRHALFVIGALSLSAAYGQTETKPEVQAPEDAANVEPAVEVTPEDTSNLSTTGSVFSIDQDTFSVTPAKVTVPLNFMYSSKTAFVDEADKSLPWEQMRTGLPVTVNYTTLGEKLMATKVTASRWMIDGGKAGTAPDEAARKREEIAESKKKKDADNAVRNRSLPAAGGGTIMSFEQVVAVRPQGSADVVQYVVNNSTHYMDTNGQPIDLNLVRTGVPVSIQYVEDSGRKIATQLVVQRITSPETKTGRATGSTGTGNSRTGTAAGTPVAGGVTNSTGVVPGTLADGFINPPVTVLPGATLEPSNPAATGTTQPGSAPSNTQPGGTPTGSPGSQPSTKQPANKQPSTPQPGAKQPSTVPAPAPASPARR